MSTSILSLHTDDYRTKGLRKQLIDSLAEKGISDELVLEAMRHIPRHFFLDPALDKIAYEDRAFPIGEGQTISQPYTVAYQSELLNITPGERVLEIGTGSAYQASILAEMGAEVFTIERQQKLYDKVQKSYPFAERHRKLYFFYGDGFKGLPEYAPFDKVLVTAAAPFVPQALLDQLKPEGMLVIPVDEGEVQRMKRIIKKADGRLIEELYDVFRFVPMLKGMNEQISKK